jgi:hypothetical protein
MGKKKEGEASAFVPATGVRLSPVDVGRTGFPQFPFALVSRAIFSPYPLFSLPAPATPAKKSKQLLNKSFRRFSCSGFAGYVDRYLLPPANLLQETQTASSVFFDATETIPDSRCFRESLLIPVCVSLSASGRHSFRYAVISAQT